MVAVQDAPEHQPSERALHDPAPGQHLECGKVVIALHDLQGPAGFVLEPSDEFTPVAAIRPHQLHPGQAVLDAQHQDPGSVAVLESRRMDDNADQEAQNINNHMAFYTLDLFPGIVARAFGPSVGLDGLRVDDKGAGFFFSSVFFRTSRQRVS